MTPAVRTDGEIPPTSARASTFEGEQLQHNSTPIAHHETHLAFRPCKCSPGSSPYDPTLTRRAGTCLDPSKVRLYPHTARSRTAKLTAPPTRFNPDGDIIFSVSKDHVVCAWFSANGERLGTYHGHVGALWTVDVNLDSTLLATGGADNTMRLWEVKTGRLLKTWEFETSIKRVEFSPDGRQLLGVTEKRSGHLSTIVVYDIIPDVEAEQTDERRLRILCEESKATVAGFSYGAKYIIAGHEDGTVSQFDAKVSMAG